MKTYKYIKTILLNIIISSIGLTLVSTASAHEYLPVCDRTEAVQLFIEAALDIPCEDIIEADLIAIKRIDVSRKNILNFLPGDFSGLPNMEILNVRSNPFKSFPLGLFEGLHALKTLVIIGGDFTTYPSDFLVSIPNLENCHCFGNKVTHISDSIIARFKSLRNLKVLDFSRNITVNAQSKLRQAFPKGGEVELTFH